MATLEYLQKHHTYAHIAAIYDIAKSNIHRGFRWVEDTLIKDGTFPLPDRNTLLKSYEEYKAILVDATETPIKRPPPPKKKKYYSVKKKRHTIKTQMLINPESEEIISLSFEKGKVHDFQL